MHIKKRIALALLASASPCAAHSAELLSIVGLDVTGNEYVEAFDITTRGIQVLAVCHIPTGWIITAGRTAGYEGELAGGASVGAAGLNQRQLGELQGLFLFSEQSHQGSVELEGTVSLRTYGSGELREVKLLSPHFRKETVSRCP
ncbi:hypothetical protein [Ferrovibrio terrae]|uniref:hypothetical protein n=1 Tax=Ferrovibrio terrae TaxID=2594003 RepID=UPI0031381709